MEPISTYKLQGNGKFKIYIYLKNKNSSQNILPITTNHQIGQNESIPWLNNLNKSWPLLQLGSVEDAVTNNCEQKIIISADHAFSPPQMSILTSFTKTPRIANDEKKRHKTHLKLYFHWLLLHSTNETSGKEE